MKIKLTDEEIQKRRYELQAESDLLQELINRRHTFPSVVDISPCHKCVNAKKCLEDGAISEGCKKCHPYLSSIPNGSEEDSDDMANMWFRYLSVCLISGKYIRTYDPYYAVLPNMSDYPGFKGGMF